MTTDDEVSDYRDAVEEFAKEYAASGKVRAATLDGPGWDEAAWTVGASQLGIPGLLIAEEHGGAGADAVVAVAAVRALASALAPGPYLGSLVAGALLSEAAEIFAAELAAIADGSARVAVAFASLDGDAGVTQGAGTLEGTLAAVPDAGAATHLALVSWTDGSAAISLVDLASDGVTVSALETLDLTRPSARIGLDGVSATTAGVDAAAVSRVRDLATVLIVAEQVGIAETSLAKDVEYSLERYAFGRQIGSFQAFKNQLAELYCVVEQMQAMLHRAVGSLGGSRGAQAVNEAACFAGPASVHVATETLRLLGGIGFTWEHDAHLRLRRATADEYLLGTPYSRRRRLATDLGLAS